MSDSLISTNATATPISVAASRSTPDIRKPLSDEVGVTNGLSGAALAVLCLVQLMVVLDNAIGNVALPAIKRDLRFSEADLQYVVSLYALCFGGLLILAARVGDVVGRRFMFIAGTALFTLASLACGLSNSPAMLLGARVAQGVGAALVIPNALALITALTVEGPQRTRALGIWAAVSTAGAATGLILSGVLTDAFGWQWCFFVNVPLGAIAIAAARPLLPELHDLGSGRRIDLPGALTITLGLGSLIYALTRGQQDGFSAGTPLALLATAVALLATFVIIERRVRRPLIPFSVFAVRHLTSANLATLCLFAVMAGGFFFSTLYMQQILGYSPLHAGLCFLPQTLMALLGAIAATQLAARFRPHRLTPIGLIITALGSLWLARLPDHGTYATDLLPGLAVLGLGLGLTFVTTTIAATNGVSHAHQGLASGLLSTSQQLGFAIGLALLVTLAVSHTDSFTNPHTAHALVAGYTHGLFAGACLAAAAAAAAVLSLPTSHLVNRN